MKIKIDNISLCSHSPGELLQYSPTADLNLNHQAAEGEVEIKEDGSIMAKFRLDTAIFSGRRGQSIWRDLCAALFDIGFTGDYSSRPCRTFEKAKGDFRIEDTNKDKQRVCVVIYDNGAMFKLHGTASN